MSTPLHPLIQAVTANASGDAFTPALQPAQWEVLGTYLQPLELAASDRLIDEKATERHLFFIESGALSVHRLSSKGEVRIALVHAGGVVGEESFFSHLPRTAGVTAAGPCKLWRLSPLRFGELAQRQPAIALELTLALAQVLARRLRSNSRRNATT
jgi:CRP/FNR family cyclic AMP-dependent transcriptional regulator